MPYDLLLHHRRSIRLQGYDYSTNGAYFVTICVNNRQCLLGEIDSSGTMRLNQFGVIILEAWESIPEHHHHVELDAFVVMPNHMHGILLFDPPSSVVGHNTQSPSNTPIMQVIPGSLGAVVRSFKSAASKHINLLRSGSTDSIWQRNYHEKIIRNERMLNALREYIFANPSNWAFDEEYPK
jgi:putative transposase